MAVREATRLLIDQIGEFVSPEAPQTIRAIYYHLVTIGALPSNDSSYNKVKLACAKARRSGEIDYKSIVDNGRSKSLRGSWESVAERAQSARFIHLNPWQDQRDRVFLIIEKDAAKHLVEPICGDYDVALYPLRGDSSLSFLYEIAKDAVKFILNGKDVHLGYWGDFDPSGMSIEAAAQRGIREIIKSQFHCDLDHEAFDGTFTWTRLGINKEDMHDYNLLPIPCKKADTKLKQFLAEQQLSHGAEIDALPAEVIIERTRDFIESHINAEQWDATKEQHSLEEARWAGMIEGIQ